MKNATPLDNSLLLYAEMSPAQIRSTQRRISAEELRAIVPGVVTCEAEELWPSLILRNRARVLAALHPRAVLGYRTAFDGGMPAGGVVHLTRTYRRTTQLPGLTVEVGKAQARRRSISR